MPGRTPTEDGIAAAAPYAIQQPEYQTKTDVVYGRVRGLVLSAALRPGEVIDQARLAESLGVSRMPLRQAIVRLASEGLVHLAPHHSPTVAPLLTRDIEEIYAIREHLETLLIEGALPNLTQVDEQELFDLCKRTQQSAAEGLPPDFASLDRAFHTRLYRVANYPRALGYFQNLRDLSDRCVAYYYTEQSGDYPVDAHDSANSHDEILDACTRRDADAAIRAMAADLRRTASNLLRIANEGTGPGA